MTASEEIESLWRKIQSIHSDNRSDASSATFKPGASETEILAEERKLGFSFPEELRASYRIHREVVEPFEGCDFSSWGYMQETIDSHNTRLRHVPGVAISKGIRKIVFGANLIPFAHGLETAYCVDTNPGEGGNVGQIVGVNFERPAATIVAINFREFLRQGISTLERQFRKRKARVEEKSTARAKPSSPPNSGSLLASLKRLQEWLSAYKKGMRREIARAIRGAEPQETRSSDAGAQPDADTLQWIKRIEPLFQQIFIGQGTSMAQVLAAEHDLGFRLPPELRALFLIHSGGVDLWDDFLILPAAQIAAESEMLNDMLSEPALRRDPGVQAQHCGERFIPFASQVGVLCMDRSPGIGGGYGQIVEVDAEEGRMKVVAKDLIQLLNWGIQALDAGT